MSISGRYCLYLRTLVPAPRVGSRQGPFIHPSLPPDAHRLFFTYRSGCSGCPLILAVTGRPSYPGPSVAAYGATWNLCVTSAF